MTNNLWIHHTGDKCPVDPDTVVEVMFANGSWSAVYPALNFSWNEAREIRSSVIIAYRIVEQPKADWEKFFERHRGSLIDSPNANFEELYQAFAARLKAEGL
jgi:hypothetical protein